EPADLDALLDQAEASGPRATAEVLMKCAARLPADLLDRAAAAAVALDEPYPYLVLSQLAGRMTPEGRIQVKRLAAEVHPERRVDVLLALLTSPNGEEATTLRTAAETAAAQIADEV